MDQQNDDNKFFNPKGNFNSSHLGMPTIKPEKDATFHIFATPTFSHHCYSHLAPPPCSAVWSHFPAPMAALVHFPVFLIAFLSQLLLTVATLQVFNVRVNYHAKPAKYSTHHHWYSHRFVEAREIRHVYDTVFHGFSASMTLEDAENLRTHAAVLDVSEDKIRHPDTTRSPEFIGLSQHNELWSKTSYGSDTIIGIVDTGIWPEHKSFSDDNLDPVPSKWKGACAVGEQFNETNCNKKLIGARHFINGYKKLQEAGPRNTLEFNSPRDAQGHGTHTASTAAGSLVKGASFNGYAAGVAKGVAPRARLAAYKACWKGIGCYNSDVIAALNSAVQDGVDIISMSLGSDADNRKPYHLDPIMIASFGVMSRGVILVFSAGNAGPTSKTVVNDAPWQLTVGAGSIDRDFPSVVSLGDGTDVSGVSLNLGMSLRNQSLALVYPDIKHLSSAASKCLNGSLNHLEIVGKIVVCVRGGSARAEKGMVVKETGGRGMIIVNSANEGEELIADAHFLPAVALGFTNAKTVYEYALTNANATATLTFHETAVGVKPAPVLASFSSRGPNELAPQILKPDVVAPGLNVLAAWSGVAGITDLDFDQRRASFNILSGTSMACPHVSGAAALLKSARPHWSPAAIRSAMMTTANPYNNLKQLIMDEATRNVASPFGLGSGYINLKSAMNPGLIYDINPVDYVRFVCSLEGYDPTSVHLIAGSNHNCSVRISPENLNYPSFSAVFNASALSGRSVKKTFVRIVTNVGSPDAIYRAKIVSPDGVAVRVKPSKLVFTKTIKTRIFAVTVFLNTSEHGLPFSGDAHGSLSWSDGRHVVRSPIVVITEDAYS